MKKASLIIYLFDLSSATLDEIEAEEKQLREINVPYIKAGNKIDKANPQLLKKLEGHDFVFISASQKNNLQALKDKILSTIHVQSVKTGDVLVTNLRHYQNLTLTQESLQRVLDGLEQGITGDFLAMDIRQALHYLGEITGSITTEDLLENIFSRFCIGK
jgi:tRNA modification GTPase